MSNAENSEADQLAWSLFVKTVLGTAAFIAVVIVYVLR